MSAMVVTRSSRPTTVSTDTRSFYLANLTTGRAFATSLCEDRITIEEIILNMKGRGEEARKRMVLASFRKREDILYHLN